MIAKASTAQNDETGDGTTSTVLIIGELLKQAEIYINEVSFIPFRKIGLICFRLILNRKGLHPRVVADGFDLAKKKSLDVLESIKLPYSGDRDRLVNIATTALNTKVPTKMVKNLTEICVGAVLAIHSDGKPIDLHMIEIMEMQHRSEEDTALVRGLVMDHGARHPDMKKLVKNAYILTCNCSLEYEKT